MSIGRLLIFVLGKHIVENQLVQLPGISRRCYFTADPGSLAPTICLAFFCDFRYKGCDVNVSVVNGPCMASCSLQFDLLYISVMVSFYCKKKGTLIRGKLYTYVWVEG